MNQDTDMNQDEGHQAELEQQEQESYGALFRALSKAQKDIVGAKKDSANPFFKSKYADLASCWDACREALTKNGLCVIQLPQRASEKIVTLQTILAHESGESISSTFSMPMKDDSPQSYGSTLTYARRYALAAIVGIAQVDDDAESGMQRTPPPAKMISTKQANMLADMIIETDSDMDGFLKACKVDSLESMPAHKFAAALKRLQDKKNA